MKYLTDKDRDEAQEKFRDFIDSLKLEQYENPFKIMQMLWSESLYLMRNGRVFRGTLGR